MWALGKLDLTVSEQSEGRSGAESRPSRTRNVADELVEAVPLRREGSGARARMVVWPRNGRSDVFRNRSGAAVVILSVCQSGETSCLSLRCLKNCVCVCVDEGGRGWTRVGVSRRVDVGPLVDTGASPWLSPAS